MAISQRAVYFYNSSKKLEKQGGLNLDTETGLYTYVDEEVNINAGDIGSTELVVAVPLAMYSDGSPFVHYLRRDGYKSGLLLMANQTRNIDGVDYQTFYITLNQVGWTYTAGRHAFIVGYLSSDGTTTSFDKLDPAFYVVSDGINNYEEINADEYEDIFLSIQGSFTDLANRVTVLEDEKANLAGGNTFVGNQTLDDNLTVGGDTSLQKTVINKNAEMRFNQIKELGAGTAGSDAVNKSQLDAVNTKITTDITAHNVNVESHPHLLSEIATKANLAGGNTFTGEQVFVEQIKAQNGLDANNSKITNVLTGTAGSDAVNKAQLDAVLTEFKQRKIIGIDLQNDILLDEFKTALGLATTVLSGLMSATDKQRLDVLHALLEEDTSNNVVDSINEILAIFNNYPEGADLVSALANKVDKNNAITAGTKTKITYDAKGLVTGGSDLIASDIPQLAPSKITQDTNNRFVTDTEKSTWNGKQDALTNVTTADIVTGTATTQKTVTAKAVHDAIMQIMFNSLGGES